MPGREIEHDLGAPKHLEESRLFVWSSCRGGTGVVREITRPRQEIGIVQDLDARIDGADPIDVLGLERRCDQHDEPVGHRGAV